MSNCDQANPKKKVFTMKQVIFNDNDERSKISNRKYYKLEGNDEIVLSSIEENPRIYPLNNGFLI
jgi:alpha-amylase/alpha-mannosidase (GH57 family)